MSVWLTTAVKPCKTCPSPLAGFGHPHTVLVWTNCSVRGARQNAERWMGVTVPERARHAVILIVRHRCLSLLHGEDRCRRHTSVLMVLSLPGNCLFLFLPYLYMLLAFASLPFKPLQPTDTQSTMADNSRSPPSDHPTTDPFTDPNPHSDGFRQTAAKAAALPLAAVGGAFAEVSRKIGELVSGHSTKIDTKHKDEPRP